MTHSDFVHLHNHSKYSLLDGACRIDLMIQRALEFRMPALAITDHGNMFGAIEFYAQAREHGIKPIIGMEAYLAPGSHTDRPAGKATDAYYHLVLLARNTEGYHNLMKLSTESYLHGFYYRPRIDKDLLRKHHEGLLATTACLRGEPAKRVLSRHITGCFGAATRQRLHMEHGLAGSQSFLPASDAATICFGASRLAIQVRALVTMSKSKRSRPAWIALSVCQPPVTSTFALFAFCLT